LKAQHIIDYVRAQIDLYHEVHHEVCRESQPDRDVKKAVRKVKAARKILVDNEVKVEVLCVLRNL